MKRVIPAIVAVACMTAAEVSFAQYGYTLSSLESLVARSDVVVRGTVIDVAREPLRERWVRKTVTLRVRETLKGEDAPRFEFVVETFVTNDLHERWKVSRQELLWFLARNESDEAPERPENNGAPRQRPAWASVLHWDSIELVASIEDRLRRFPPPPIYTMDLTLLERPSEILRAARRAVREESKQRHPGHGVMLSRFLTQRTGTSGDANVFVVPVDRRLESVARRWIASPGDFIPQPEDLKEDEERERWLQTERHLLRREGVKALQYFQSDENIAILRGLLDDPVSLMRTRSTEDGRQIREKVYYIREAAYEVLQNWEIDDARRTLAEEPAEAVERLLSTPDANKLLANMRALETPAAEAALIRILRDEQQRTELRTRAANVLGRIGGQTARQALIEVLAETEQPEFNKIGSLWSRLLTAVGRCLHQQTEQELLADLGHEHPHVRWLAATELGKRKSNPAVPPLIRMLDEEDFAPRLGATWALGEIAHRDGIAELIAIVERRRQGGSRISAIEAMGKVRTPRSRLALDSVLPDDPEHWKAADTRREWEAAGPSVETSDWGAEVSGLQLRVAAPAATEQGVPLEVALELRSDPANLPRGVRDLNTFLRARNLELVLTEPKSGKSWSVKPRDPTGGMPPPPDRGESVVALDGTPLEPWTVKFPLAEVYETLPPGEYEARVRFAFPEDRRSAAGQWDGTVVSGTCPLKVARDTPKNKTLLLPERLRLSRKFARLREDDPADTALPAIVFAKEDAEKATVPVRNGHFIGAWIYHDGKPGKLSGPPQPDSPNPIDAWYDYEKGGREITYTIEVFETAEPPQHGWLPGPGSGGYKVLWKKTFALSFTEKEIREALEN